MSVTARLEPRVIPTYPVGAPEKNPVFFEKRVYQGSSGKVYPVPFVDKVHDEPVDVTYQSALLENDFVRLVMLPEIGGRIFLGQDKTNDDYDFFYRQEVIKPALVGLAGPWVSGGVEFNWPQHHRPGTFMPADVHIEEESDGAYTVWMSEHDPLNRLKGMHGIRLRPGSSLIELRARLYNRTPFVHTFLWWANVAARVHDQYQSFFPADVHYVADHAVRASSSFPVAENDYYGIDYAARPGANDLSWYKNIPVPTSYMVCQTLFDFFGGYDFEKDGGFVHIANRHIAPGKKQWTWGNDRFGWAWDRELTDEGGPYVELMAGVYTDNQPDFTYLLPYETKTFSQFWWPIQNIGPVQQANETAALALAIRDDRSIRLGLCVSEPFEGELVLTTASGTLARFPVSLKPGESFSDESTRFAGENPAEVLAELRDASGALVLDYRPVDTSTLTRDRQVATEPPAPEDIPSSDELYFTGEHLEQYRHPTRSPEPYWEEALRRDPGDSRCRTALGRRALLRGEFETAREHLVAAVSRLTLRHPNPVTGEAHYHLGLAVRFLGQPEDAYRAFYKATWNYEWRSSAYYQLATLDARKRDWSTALEHLDASLDTNRDHNKARVLRALVLQQLDRPEEARHELDALLTIDPLDHWASATRVFVTRPISSTRGMTVPVMNQTGDLPAEPSLIPPSSRNDAQTVLDLAFDYLEAGFDDEALALLDAHHAAPVDPVAVPNPLEKSAMTLYLRARITGDAGDLEAARSASPDHFFPSRLEEMELLEWALAGNVAGASSPVAKNRAPSAQPEAATVAGASSPVAKNRASSAQPEAPATLDPLAAYGLGNFYFDKRRHADAIAVWERAVEDGTTIPQVHRNLGIAVWNHHGDGERAAACYERARQLAPSDARLVSESDQLAKKRNRPLAERLAFLESHDELVRQRDEATVEVASLLNLTGRPEEALDLLLSRRFHPWEGGEGAVLRQYTAARLLIGERALDRGDAEAAHEQFSLAMDTPDSLGEAYHLLQAKADVNYWIGRSLRALGRGEEATAAFEASASESGDFSEMAVAEHSPLSYFRGLSLRELGRDDEAVAVFRAMLEFAAARKAEPATIDYFATSLPNLLVFDEDLQARRDAEADLIAALAHHGLGELDEAAAAVRRTLDFDRSLAHAVALEARLETTTA